MPTEPRGEPQGRLLREVLGDNIRLIRLSRHLSQTALAELMQQHGHSWVQTTVSTVERGRRNVTVDELLAIAEALDTTFVDLLNPTGVEGTQTAEIEIGGGMTVPPHALAYRITKQGVRDHVGRTQGRIGAVAWTELGPTEEEQ